MNKIVKILFIIIVLPLCVGCFARKKTISDQRDSTIVRTVFRLEYIKDTVLLEIPVEKISQTIEDSSHLETDFAVSDARILLGGRLYHSLENKPHKRPVEINRPVEYRDSIVYRDRIVDKTIEVPAQLNKWQRFQITGFWFLVGIVGVVGFIKLKKLLF